MTYEIIAEVHSINFDLSARIEGNVRSIPVDIRKVRQN